MNKAANKLDFRSISFGRVATVAVNTALDRHPKLHAPSWRQCDELIEKRQLLNHNTQKSCLTVHHHRWFDKEHQSEMRHITSLRADKQIHVVRDPMTQVIGWYNHIVSSAALGMYGWTYPGTFDEFLAGNHAVFPCFYNEMQAKLFYPQASDTFLVEFSQLDESNFADTINNIFSFFGMEKQTIPYIGTQIDLAASFLTRGFELKLNGEAIKFSMRQESLASDRFKSDYFNVVDNVSEIMNRLCPSLRTIAGRVYIGFDPETQITQSTYDLINRHWDELAPQIIEGWALNAERMTKEIHNRTIKELKPAQRDKFWKLIRDDLRAFSRRHPQLQGKWQLT